MLILTDWEVSMKRAPIPALRGEEVIIAKRDKPLVRLVPFAEGGSARRIGTAKGRIRIHEDFDSLPDGFDEYTT